MRVRRRKVARLALRGDVGRAHGGGAEDGRIHATREGRGRASGCAVSAVVAAALLLPGHAGVVLTFVVPLPVVA